MKRIFLALLSGVLLGAPFVVPALWPLVLLGLAPLLVALSGERLSAPKTFGLGFLAGLTLYGEALFAIFWTVLPLDWLGIFDPVFQIIIVAVSWTLTAAGFAIWTGFFAVLFSRLRCDSWRDIVIAPALWILAEWAGAWWFGIQNIGPGSILGPHFTLSFIGNALAHDTALVQLAWLGGVYALSAFAALTGVFAHRFMRASARERVVLIICLAALGAAWLGARALLARAPSAPVEHSLRVAIVSTQRSATFGERETQAARDADSLTSLLRDTRGSTLVALPEGTDFLRALNAALPSHAEDTLRTLYAGETRPVVIDSGNAYSSVGTVRSRATLYDVGSDAYAYQDKRFLLPDGEYVPAYVHAWVSAIGKSEALDAVSGKRGLTPGDDIRPLAAAGTKIGVLFCNEAMSPELYRSLALNGAEVFVNVASHAWFHGSRLVADQMKSVAVVRAVEARRWLVQSSNIAPSFALDPYGRTATSSAWGSEGVITAEVGVRTDTTPYVRFGPWLLWAALFALLITRMRFIRSVG